MNIFTIKGIGRQHPLHTEDHLYSNQIGNRWFVGAVMDGCSSAVESYFPSTLYAKSLAKGSKLITSNNESTAKEIGEGLLQIVMNDLRTVQETLNLNLDEILATMILLVVDLEKSEAHAWAAGDGCIVCDGEITEIGSRIIEYPSRLQTYRDIPMYGRELFIKIPPENKFLSGERVFVTINH